MGFKGKRRAKQNILKVLGSDKVRDLLKIPMLIKLEVTDCDRFGGKLNIIKM